MFERVAKDLRICALSFSRRSASHTASKALSILSLSSKMNPMRLRATASPSMIDAQASRTNRTWASSRASWTLGAALASSIQGLTVLTDVAPTAFMASVYEPVVA